MEKKELVMEIIGLYDEVTRLQEENKMLKLQQGLAKISGSKVVLEESEPEERSPKTIIGDIIRRDYFEHNFWYYPVVVNNGEEKFTRTFDEWFKHIGVEEMFGYNKELLSEVSVRDIKKFFLPELKAGYQKLLDAATKEGGEEDGE